MFTWLLIALTAAAHVYLGARLLRPWLRGRWVWAARLGVFASAAGLPLLLIVARHETPNAFRPLAVPVFLWLGFLLLLLLVSLAAEPARLALWLAWRRRSKGEDSGEADLPRRRLISGAISAGVVAGAAGGTALGLARAMGPERVVKLEVPLADLPPGMDGYRLVQLSDLHIGTTRGPAWLAEVVRRVNGLAPDAVVITGDLADQPASIIGQEVAPLRELRAPGGVFFVTGNHEFYAGADAWCALLSRLGLSVLRNSRVSLGGGLDLAGVEDPVGARVGRPPDLEAALAGRGRARPCVLLAHRPRAVIEASRHGVDLVLSGHTHGGQLWPMHHFVAMSEPYLAGLHRHRGTMIYVNSGTGFWGPPLRIGSAPEITQLTLRSG